CRRASDCANVDRHGESFGIYNTFYFTTLRVFWHVLILLCSNESVERPGARSECVNVEFLPLVISWHFKTNKVKPVFEQTPSAQWESFHCEVVRGDSYHAAWHFHPEYQLTLVIKSNGHRLVGDKIAPLHAGDLVLVGSNLPHVWQQDEISGGSGQAVHAIIIR